MKMLIVVLAMFLAMSAEAQKKGIDIRTGTTLEYMVYPGGQVFPMIITVDSSSNEYVRLAWTNSVGRGGKYILTRASLDSATTAFWGPPQYDEDVVLDPNVSLLFFSRRQWNELIGSGKVEFDGAKYAWRDAVGNKALLINNVRVDAIYLESENSSARIWILNNAKYPMILKIENNPMGVDLEITGF
ncbi:MAG: hypothetical protein H7Y31_17260 [Chitinophagaceae bacterium]|nr:hypothetical protein [Chitinophagaceae bacterium]